MVNIRQQSHFGNLISLCMRSSKGGRGMHVPLRSSKPFHFAVLKGSHIIVGNYFNSIISKSCCFSLFFGLHVAQCCLKTYNLFLGKNMREFVEYCSTMVLGMLNPECIKSFLECYTLYLVTSTVTSSVQVLIEYILDVQCIRPVLLDARVT